MPLLLQMCTIPNASITALRGIVDVCGSRCLSCTSMLPQNCQGFPPTRARLTGWSNHKKRGGYRSSNYRVIEGLPGSTIQRTVSSVARGKNFSQVAGRKCSGNYGDKLGHDATLPRNRTQIESLVGWNLVYMLLVKA